MGFDARKAKPKVGDTSMFGLTARFLRDSRFVLPTEPTDADRVALARAEEKRARRRARNGRDRPSVRRHVHGRDGDHRGPE